jgi:hypothetical protein
MAETDTSPPVTAISATSVKRERASSPETTSDATSSLKRVKGENGDAVPVDVVVPVSSQESEVKEEQVKEKPEEPVATAAPTKNGNGNGHPAPKMNDDKMEGYVMSHF